MNKEVMDTSEIEFMLNAAFSLYVNLKNTWNSVMLRSLKLKHTIVRFAPVEKKKSFYQATSLYRISNENLIL